MGLRRRRSRDDDDRAQRRTVTYVYDNDGELTDTTDDDGRRTTYSYNADGDQTGETWVGASPSEKITYTYDADNEMTGAADSLRDLDLHLRRRRRAADRRDLRPGHRPADGDADLQLRPARRRDQRDRQPVEPGDHDLHLRRRPADDERSRRPTAARPARRSRYGYDNGGRLTSISRTIGGSGDAGEHDDTATTRPTA